MYRRHGYGYRSRFLDLPGCSDVLNADRVNLSGSEEKKITDLLEKIKINDVEEFSEAGASCFQREYSSHIQGNVETQHSMKARKSALKSDPVLDRVLLEESERRKSDSLFLKMLEFRKSLPALKQEEEIVDAVNSNQVVVISGETGCGKTTQVSQFLLDSMISQGRGSLCHIVCTQPRRISAISVSERVAEERAETCGGENSAVGYQIRLESKKPRARGSILYCTTGIVLQWLKSDSHLEGVSHLILDEIHERDLDSDFLMIILKDILPIRPDLKLILMSATLNADVFSKYFFNCPMVHIPGYTFPVEEFYLEDIIEKTGYDPKFKKDAYELTERETMRSYLRTVKDKYSRKTFDTLYTWNEDKIDLNLIVSLLRHICLKEKEGAILIFLPGWAEISSLHTLLTQDVMFRTSGFLLIPLHSMMPTVNQKEVFNPTPEGIRKIVIATNIAETSITINDVVFVIDSGFIKMENFDVKANTATLKPEWVSMANARQRRGRAGRVKPGVCYKLYTRARELKFDQYCKPEMLRTRLETLCLKLKILKLGCIEEFLSKAMDPPAAENVKLSVDFLKKLNALDGEEQLTPLGFHLARLPLDPQTGRMILFGAIFSCLTVAAGLTFKDAFVTPLGKEHAVNQRKDLMADNSESDHLMLANAMEKYERACANEKSNDFCYKNFLSRNTLKMLASLKKQFATYLCDLHYLHSSDPKHKDFNRNSGNRRLLKAVICAGLYPNIGKLKSKINLSHGRRGTPFVRISHEEVKIHPKSILNRVPLCSSLWTVYYKKVKSTKVFLHDLTLVEPCALLLFGGQLTVDRQEDCVILSMENWIKFNCQERVAELILALRKELDGLLEHKVTSPGGTDWNTNCKEGAVLQSIVDLFSSEDKSNLHSGNFEEQDDLEEYLYDRAKRIRDFTNTIYLL